MGRKEARKGGKEGKRKEGKKEERREGGRKGKRKEGKKGRKKKERNETHQGTLINTGFISLRNNRCQFSQGENNTFLNRHKSI